MKVNRKWINEEFVDLSHISDKEYVETLTILEDYLTEFSGAVVAVSHDRYFLDKIATSILEVRGDGEVRRTMGGYSDWLLLREMDEKPIVKKENRAPREKRTDRPQKLKFSFKEQREPSRPASHSVRR